jgi:hypothetical protein
MLTRQIKILNEIKKELTQASKKARHSAKLNTSTILVLDLIRITDSITDLGIVIEELKEVAKLKKHNKNNKKEEDPSGILQLDPLQDSSGILYHNKDFNND